MEEWRERVGLVKVCAFEEGGGGREMEECVVSGAAAERNIRT